MVSNQNLTEKGKRDLVLIEKALNNDDKKAYSQLMQLYRDPIYYMLYEKVGNEEIAKDLTTSLNWAITIERN